MAKNILNSNLSDEQKWVELKNRTGYYVNSRGDRRMKDKEHIANNYMNELDIHGDYRKQVLSIVNRFNLKKLHSKCSEKQIIAMICFYVISKYNNKIRLEDRALFRHLHLDYKMFSRVMINYCNLSEKGKVTSFTHNGSVYTLKEVDRF